MIPQDLTAKVDSLVTLQIYNNFKGKSLVPRCNHGLLDIEGIISLLVGFLALWYGFQSMHTPGYMLFQASLRTHGKAFWCIVFSRLLLFFGAFLCVIALVYMTIGLRGVEFSPEDLAGLGGFLGSALVMLFAFFFIGVFTGTFGRRAGAYLSLLAAWGILNFGISWALNEVFEPKFPDVTIDYQTELDKYKKLMDFENSCEEKAGKFNRDEIDIEKEFAERYWNVDYKRINAVETGLINLIRENIKKYNRVCLFFPTGFYRQTVNEASGGGYINYLLFYDYVQEMQAKFVRFYIDRTYYHDPKNLVNFIKGDEDIFRAKSCLPHGYGTGIMINMVYALIFLLASYSRYKRMLFPGPIDAAAFAKVNIRLESGEKITIGTERIEFISQWVKLFFGKSRDLEWRVTLDGKSIVTGKQEDMIYLPNPGQVPGELKGRHLVDWFRRLFRLPPGDMEKIEEELGTGVLDKRFRDMEPLEKAGIVLTLAARLKRRVYLFDDFARGVPDNLRQELENMLGPAAGDSTLVIDIASSDCYWLTPDRKLTVAYKMGEYRVF